MSTSEEPTRAVTAVPPLRVLSIQLPLVGNKTYGEMLRRAFEGSSTIEFFAYWTHEQREIHSRILNRAMYTRLPVPWIMRRNLDLSKARREFGYGYYGRRLVDRHIHKDRPDVLHFHTQTAALLSADYIRKIPTVITTDQTAMQASMEFAAPWRWTFFGNVMLERAPLRAAAAVVVLSQWAADSMIAGHGISSERVHVIPPGIDARIFTDAERPERETKRLLFVGADFARKGGAQLVDIFIERLASRNVELHLVTKALDIRSHPKVIVHRDISAYSAQWMQLYENADVFVLPTRWDAFGLAYIEAMAAGLPVVGSSLAAGPEIIADGETGFLIDPSDGRGLAERLERLLDDATLRHAFGKRGRARVIEKFDADKNAKRLEAVFFDVALHAIAARGR